MKRKNEHRDTYLRVTIHDNDYYSSLKIIANVLYEVFCGEEKWPAEEDFPKIKEYIKHIWYGSHAMMSYIRWKNTRVVHQDPDINYLEPELSIVSFNDIPYWDNCESAYIPMFDDADIMYR